MVPKGGQKACEVPHQRDVRQGAKRTGGNQGGSDANEVLEVRQGENSTMEGKHD